MNRDIDETHWHSTNEVVNGVMTCKSGCPFMCMCPRMDGFETSEEIAPLYASLEIANLALRE